MSVNLLTEHHLEVLSLKGGCTGTSESIHVKMPHCWKSHVAAHIYGLLTVSFPPSSLMPWTGNGLAGAVLLQQRRPHIERISLIQIYKLFENKIEDIFLSISF